MSESKGERSETLYSAAAFGKGAEVTRLLQAGADANHLNADGEPPAFNVLELSMAEGASARPPREIIFRELWQAMNAGARLCQDNIGRTVLHVMAMHGFDKLVAEVCADAPDLVEKRMATNQYNTGECPIHTAVLNGNLPVVEALYAIDPFAATRTDLENQTPLHYAAREGSLDMVTACSLQHQRAGLDIDVKDENGMTPLAWAEQAGNGADVKAYLIEQGADEDKVDLRSQTQVSRF